MTYDEYTTLIKAKFDEVQSKANFDVEGYKTITGFSQSASHNGVTAHIALTLCGEIQAILEQINNYAHGMIDQIKEDAKREEREKIERVKKAWNNDNKEKEE